MAQELKLQIFKIGIKRRKTRNKDLLLFKELFDSLNEDKKLAYNKFVEDYRGLFDGKFQSNGNKSKSISTTKNNEFNIRSENNLIDGEIFGGSIGSLQTIYEQNNAEKEIGQVGLDQIASLPFYVKLWTPYDHNSGILMVQSYSNFTVTELFKITIKKLFATYGFTIVFSPFISKSLKDEYISNAMVYEMKIINDHVSKDKRKIINPIFAEEEKLKITISITGFNQDPTSFWEKIMKTKGSIIGANLEDLDISEKNGYDLKAFYKDEAGHKANVRFNDNLDDILPSIFLPKELQSVETNHFNFEKIKTFTDGILDDIKNEIGYNKC